MALTVSGAAVWFWASAPDRSDTLLVRDEAALMTPDQRAFVAGYHEHLLDAFDIDYRVVTVRGLEDINLRAVEMLRTMGKSSRSRSGRALLLMIDVASNQVRLEVGYPLEGSFPDAFVDHVERRQMVPFFEADRVADGILATTELVVARAQRNAGDLGVASEAWLASSGGGGAVTEARLGAGPRNVAMGLEEDVRPGNTPEGTLRAYFRAMAAHNASPALALYTPETGQMLTGRVMTPAQMDNVVRTYRHCVPGNTLISAAGDLAVIGYLVEERTCAPFFFQRGDGAWQLDLTMMQDAIRFDTANAWRLVPQSSHPYRFAFDDWRFDARGYPQGPR